MTLRRWVRRSLRHNWRAHIGVVAGVAVASSILIGALDVGDSVRHSLAMLTSERLEGAHLALAPAGRFFREDLATDLGVYLPADCYSWLLLPGSAARADGTARVNRVQLLGMGSPHDKAAPADGAWLNPALLQRLGLTGGSTIIIRGEKPSVLPRDAPLAQDERITFGMRCRAGEGGSEFSLSSDHGVRYNAEIPVKKLQEAAELPGKANVITVDLNKHTPITVARAQAALRKVWLLADAQLELRELPERAAVELRSERIFLEAPVIEAARSAAPGAVGILTYLVNELRNGERATPYSLVTAIGPLAEGGGGVLGGAVPDDMRDDEIVINSWLAEDLAAAEGDEIELAYFVVGPLKTVTEKKTSFRVRAVVPIEGAAGDPTLMPPFPGMAESENCKSWDAGLPIDTERIRPKDEEYWNAHRGTPKAFVSLRAGERMWGNRFGSLTAIRYPGGAETAAKVRAHVLGNLDPASIGLVFENVRARAEAGVAQAVDFGALFLGMSFFLLAAALLLVGLLFVLGIEARASEIGTLHALGVPRRTAGRLFLVEGAILAALGAVLGPYGGIAYTEAVLWGLAHVWHGAVGLPALHVHVVPATLGVGVAASFLMALGALWATLRFQAWKSIRSLLAPAVRVRAPLGAGRVVRLPSFIVGAAALAGAAAVAACAGGADDRARAGIFFGVGALLLVSGVAFSSVLIRWHARPRGGAALGVLALALKNASRRRGRSLAAAGLLACGTFLIIAVGANRRDPFRNADSRAAGTGGFALFGDTSLPVFKDLNAEEGRKAYALEEAEMRGVRVVPFRVREGDDASCLNLARAQRPRLFGVAPGALAGRFTFAATERETDAPWSLLDERGHAVPAIGDENTVTWSLGAKVGSTLPYVGERGEEFTIMIVGTVARSVLQGGLVIAEDRFIERFPSESGYRMFLMDVEGGPASAAAAGKRLTRSLEDIGMAAVPCAERLAAFNVVEHTYLSIFQALGGLGLILGSIGMGVIVLRNVLERRGELALLRAVGVGALQVTRLVLWEHLALVVLGVAVGVGAALPAVSPSLLSPGADVPVASLAVTVVLVALSAGLWTWAAAAWAMRGVLTEGLRDE